MTESVTERKKGGRPLISQESEVMNVIVPTELMKRVRKLAEVQDKPIARVVRRALLEMVEREGV